jgi:anti-sigma B factor antagonist
MTVRERDGGPVVVSMPAEIDLANAGRVGEQLCTAASPGVTIIVADLTGTQFCDSAGIRTLLRARDDVAASHAQLRLAVARSGAVRRALQAIGVQYVLPVYPTVAAALAPDVPSSRSAQ